ncbi:MAG TPA: PHP domain-containing protein [Solirubrobacteraceae bacterium]|nr:PHP domain-containing protein [Solirubrobacteraceae bacterium]
MSSELSNAAIADALEELGDLYELDGAIVHRVVAYRTGAKAVREAPVSVAALAREGRAVELSGIGATLQEKIVALLDTGTIPAAEKLRARIPAGLVELTRLPGLGPKRARLLHAELGIDSLATLHAAALAGKLRGVRGLGAKFEQSVIAALQSGAGERRSPRLLLPKALALGRSLADGLIERGGEGTRVLIAGSARRMVDSVKDLDLVAVTTRPVTLARSLAKLPEIEAVSTAGKAGARARTHSGTSVDLRIATPAQLGNLLQHFTGSGKHNAALREAAVRRGLHVSEYGVLDDATGATIACASEQEVYGMLGLAYIEPELREDRGELAAAARQGKGEAGGSLRERRTTEQERREPSATSGEGLPRLIETSDLRGDLHCHTVASDGRNTIEEMALAARDLGYEYLAITDHSASHGFGDEVSPEQLRRQIELVAEADASIPGIRLLAGSEVNILPDGSLDYEDELLARLDWVIASVHTSFGRGEQAMTERMIAAIEHPLVDAIGHPTGRKIDRREPYALDLAAVIEAAARTGTMLEINANPDRRDLNEIHARAAAQAGVRILIDSDAHGIERLPEIRWGVATARRAWLTAAEVANTRGWEQFARMRKKALAEPG